MNLITGATGLVGAHVALQLLQQGKSVVAIKREGSDLSKTKKLFSYYTSDFEQLFNQIKWVDADISDIYSILDALEGIETVYHCAGFVSFNHKQKKANSHYQYRRNSKCGECLFREKNKSLMLREFYCYASKSGYH